MKKILQDYFLIFSTTEYVRTGEPAPDVESVFIGMLFFPFLFPVFVLYKILYE